MADETNLEGVAPVEATGAERAGMLRSVAVRHDWRSPNPNIASGVGGVAIVTGAEGVEGVTIVVTKTLIAVVVRVIENILAAIVESDTVM